MVLLSKVEEQLQRIGCNFRFWGRPEIRELANILVDNEIIAGCVNGRYEGGFALLCVTNHRLLLIDRKPMFLSLEDVRFDMIAEIDFSARLLESSVHIQTPNRKLVFTSWNQQRLRNILNYTQQRVMEVRQHYMMHQIPQAAQVALPQQPMPEESAPFVGGLALQAQGATGNIGLPRYISPYAKTSFMMKRRGYRKFY